MSERPALQSGVERFRRTLIRAVLPRLLLRATRASHAVRQGVVRAESALGSRPRVDLYFAFDDPYGVIAVGEMVELTRRHGADLIVYPVVDHGIRSDPDLPLRRAYALKDADRLLRRSGRTLSRKTEIESKDVHFLAAWTEAARARDAAAPFAAAALSELWLAEEGTIDEKRYREIYDSTVHAAPPAPSASLDADLARNAARLRSRGHWETPAVWVAGEWFFAHERASQVGELLTRLGG